MLIAKYGLHNLLPGSVFGVVLAVVLAVWIVKEACDSIFEKAKRSGMPLTPVSEAGYTVELNSPSTWLIFVKPKQTQVIVRSPDGNMVGQWSTFEPENSEYLIRSMIWKSPASLTFHAVANEVRVVVEQADPQWRVTEIAE